MAHETETDLPLFLASTDPEQVMEVLVGDDDEDVVFGRMPVGGAGDASEFDIYPPDTINLTEEEQAQITSTESVEGDGRPHAFESPPLEQFPAFRAALRKFQGAESKPRVVRIDTEETFTGLVADHTVKELARRVDELRAMFEAHVSDHHGGSLSKMRKWDVIGAAESVTDLRNARTTDEAVDAMPKVHVDLPDWADGKVKCWRSGDTVMCSVRFQAADGGGRIATSAARPRVDAEDVANAAMLSGCDPVTVLGALPALTDSVCGKRLVRDVAGAALKAQRRLDVCGMDGPMLMATGGEPSKAPMAALMHLMQCADAGDSQCTRELAAIVQAAQTPSGREIAMPLLLEAKQRLDAARAKRKRPSLLERVKGWLR